MDITIIAAVAEDGTIGKDGGIPWDYPRDMEHFKEATMGHPVIMGRGTWDSFRRGPLPGRTNIVISHEELDDEGIVNVHAIDEAVGAARQAADAEEAYVIGGESIYRQFLERGLADRLVLTEIPGEYDGDTFFPDWDRESWEEVAREEDGELAFVTYEPA